MTNETPPAKPTPFKPAPPPDPDRIPKPAAKRTTKRTTRRTGPTFETRVGAFIFQTNTLLRQIPWTADDALDAAELTMLTKGIVDEANRHPVLKRYIEAALDASSLGGLALTVTIIAGRRVARHDLLPAGLPMSNEQIDATLGAFLGMTVNADRETYADMAGRAAQQPPAFEPDVPPKVNGA